MVVLMSGWSLVLVGVAALAAGVVNALAGGGTLITFPMLTAVGLPAVAANVTNTVALCPGYLGATLAQTKDLHGQQRRLWLLLPAAVLGGIIGGFLLLHTGRPRVPYACAIPDPARLRVAGHARSTTGLVATPGWTYWRDVDAVRSATARASRRRCHLWWLFWSWTECDRAGGAGARAR